MGLRERKKLATRQALSHAALRLALERGWGNVVREDIAAAAGVSVRTFNNYFSSKEEAIVSLAVARAGRIATALRARPAAEPLAGALIEAFAEQYAGAGQAGSQWTSRIRLIVAAPELRAEYLKALVVMERSLAEAIAERLGTDLEHDLYPHVLAAAVYSTERVAITRWLESGSPAGLRSLLREALTRILDRPPREIEPKGNDNEADRNQLRRWHSLRRDHDAAGDRPGRHVPRSRGHQE
jgi:AcrR family transcriptional regulator